MDHRTQALCAFLNEAHSQYHAIAALTRWLTDAGYTHLNEGSVWQLEPGKGYFISRNASSIVAFRVPEGTPAGYMISASHCDHPCFKVKENGTLVGTYTRLATEKYGGMLIAPWLDRPLSIAGRVLVETENGVEARLVDIDKDIALIPNLAIHLNRTANESQSWNVAVDTLPLLGGKDAGARLEEALQAQAGGKILGHDLYLYLRQKATVWGLEDEYIASPALDDLDCVWGCTQGFLKSKPSRSIPVLCVFDSEEVGSNSPQGADGTILSGMLERISRCLGLDNSRLLSNSFMVSADNVHAVHPNHPEFTDSVNTVLMNEGVALKFNAAQRYTTDGLSAAIFRKICETAKVPVQSYYNRADIKGGSTLGHISLNHVSVPSVDIGLPQLAMHSSYETAGVQDAIYLEEAMTAYYSTTLEVKDGAYTLN